MFGFVVYSFNNWSATLFASCGKSRKFVCFLDDYMDTLPQDTNMLYSIVNMKLRDQYASLDELCDDMDINRKELEDRLAQGGFKYDAKQNCFS